MTERVVDVFLKDELVSSYPVIRDTMNAQVLDRDFIDRVKECMREDKYTEEEIAAAKFSVRDIWE